MIEVVSRNSIHKRPSAELLMLAGRPLAAPPQVRSCDTRGYDTLWETLEPRVLLTTAPLVLGHRAAINQAVSQITFSASSEPVYLPSVSNLSGTFTTSTAAATSLISLDQFRNDARFTGIDGSGFSAVILDTGIDLDHPFFGPDANSDGIADRIVYQYDFANNDGNASDYNGHGSNVSSIVASSDITYPGIAPGADIIHLKVFTDAGVGNFSYVERALQWCVANAATYNIASINMSLGDSGNWSSSPSLYGIGDELSALAAMDVITVAAAGNDFYRFNSAPGLSYPAADTNTISVGAVYQANAGGFSYGSGAAAYSSGADVITPFSQRHPVLLDVFAPGAPITGAGPTGNLTTQHGTSQAAPHIAGVAVLAQQLAMQTFGRRLTVSEFRQLLQSSADTIFDGDDENDNVTNTGLSYPRVNVFALGQSVLAMAPPDNPEIQVLDGNINVTDGSSTINLGSTTLGTAVTRTFTVRNLGRQPLQLNGDIALPPGFSLVSGFGVATLAANSSTAFTIRLNATGTGTFGGVLSFTNNDSDESPFNFNLIGSVSPWAKTIDNTSPDFATSGLWGTRTGGLGGNQKFSNNQGTTATWTFDDLAAGQYRIYTTWAPSGDHPGDAPYTFTDGTHVLGQATVNQLMAPSGPASSGVNWQLLASPLYITGGKLIIRLTSSGNGSTLADAVRIERFAELPLAARIAVSSPTNDVTRDGIVNFGSTYVDNPAFRSFTVRNTGQATLNLGSIALPDGFTLTRDFDSTTLTTGQSTTFTIRMDAQSADFYGGLVSFTTSDPDNSFFAMAISGSVTIAPVLRVLDDGDATSSFSGGPWLNALGGYGNSQSYSDTAGASHSWLFTDLTPGSYRVLTTYNPAASLASRVNYAAFDGATLRQTTAIDQRTSGTDMSYAGRNWSTIGSNVSITGNSMTVIMTVPAGGYAAADAVYVERMGEIEPAMVDISLTPPRFASDLPIGTRVTRLPNPAWTTPLGNTLIQADTDDNDFFLMRKPSRLAA